MLAAVAKVVHMAAVAAVAAVAEVATAPSAAAAAAVVVHMVAAAHPPPPPAAAAVAATPALSAARYAQCCLSRPALEYLLGSWVAHPPATLLAALAFALRDRFVGRARCLLPV